MIVDQLEHAKRYRALHPGFAGGFDFLHRPDLASLPDGRYDIDGDRVFALVARDQGRGRPKSPLESHRRYADIQFIIGGQDCIGWLPTAACERVSQAYDPDTDLGFYYDRPQTWLEMAEGTFAIFFPEDAHAPLATNGLIHKAIVKILL